MPNCRQTLCERTLGIFDVNISGLNMSMPDELDAKHICDQPFPGCGGSHEASWGLVPWCGIAAGTVNPKIRPALFKPGFERGLLVVVQRVSTRIVLDDELEFTKLVRIHDCAVFRDEKRQPS